MEPFVYREGRLHAEGVDLSALAETFGTPCYVYSRAAIEAAWRAYDRAFGARPHLVCYAVKANANLAVLNVLARLGAGFDIVSAGELERVLAAGGDPGRVVFSGVGKSRAEMARALEAGIRCFNVESVPELERLEEVAAALGRRAPVSLRVNPDVDPETHPYIATGLRDSKFGVAIDEAEAVYRRATALPHLEVLGVDCHIGSQLTSVSPFLDALDRVLDLVDRLAAAGTPLRHVDLGGGLGVRYRDERAPDPGELVTALLTRLAGRTLEVLLEPGRSVIGPAGLLLTRVEYVKTGAGRDFVIVDAAMNDLLRPALYQAWQSVVPVVPRAGEGRRCDVVGPVCETGDFLARDRVLTVRPGDLLAVQTAGAYGFAMSSNYNARPRAAEVMVDGARAHLARRRETPEELYAGERVLPDD
ncbi:MAG: diaminopimelate decarboxylase [Gammaproteobacteria bacterium]|nr:diaminopimelate decarboxylase [Gammaproteobacteria bacterium]